MASQFRFLSLLFIAHASCGFISLYAQSPQFVDEMIEVRVYGEYCTVVGTYSFKNHGTSDASWTVFYPLLNNADLPFPDSLFVMNIETKDTVTVTAARNGISYSISVPASKTRKYKVYYRQRTPARRMEYILTSTRQWGRPLERATFSIIIPDSFLLASISIPFNDVENRWNERVYHIRKNNFLPRNNLVIRWKRKGK